MPLSTSKQAPGAARLKAVQRYELKYLLDRDQALAVKQALQRYVTPDAHAAGDSTYLVTSLYYDTPNYKAYWDKIDGHKYRRKVRVRVYGDGPVSPSTPVFVEIKQRQDRAQEKRRVRLAFRHAASLEGLEKLLDDVSADERRVLEEVLYLSTALRLQPACIVSYQRSALNGDEFDPGLRITFDTQLKGRVHDLSLASIGHGGNAYFVPPDQCVMEVKINHRLPFWLSGILAQHNCALRRISKYCAALEVAKGNLVRQHLVS